jgi:hypothetical protein
VKAGSIAAQKTTEDKNVPCALDAKKQSGHATDRTSDILEIPNYIR